MKTTSIALLCFIMFTSLFAAERSLQKDLRDIIKPYDATVGVAVQDLLSDDVTAVNGRRYFPMQSVYKFHLALAVLHDVDNASLSLDQILHLCPDDLLPNTWSPLRERYPDANVDLPLRDVLTPTIAYSDNNGCDILFRLIGGPAVVEKYLRDNGIRHTDIRATEYEMSREWTVQYTNRTTPRDAVKAMALFYNGAFLEQKTHDYLWATLVETVTGASRLKGQLPKGTTVAHKTGTSARGENGRRAAVNDLGIILLPDGHPIAIGVFITDSAEDDATNDLIIARIAKAVWDHYHNQ